MKRQKGSWLLSVVLAFLLAFVMNCSTTEAATENSVNIPTEQWQALKQKLALLDANLMLAEQLLNEQESTSSELLNKLQQAQNELAKTQEELINSKTSLANVEASLMNVQTSYETLTKQIEAERKRTQRIKYQRDGYLVLAAVFLVTAVAK